MAARQEPFIAEGVEKYGLEVAAKEWVSLRPMLEVANRISESCLAKEWQFFVPHDDVRLVTSDNPVHFSLPRSAGPIMAGPSHPAVEIIVNLRPDLALVCTPPRTGGNLNVYKLNKVDSRRFNRGTARAAQSQIYASQNLKGLLALTEKYANVSQSLIV